VTSDIDKFASAICNLYTTVSKPLLDVILFTRKLMYITGWQGPLLMYAYFFISGMIKKFLMPPLGKVLLLSSSFPHLFAVNGKRIRIRRNLQNCTSTTYCKFRRNR
jgi:ABC-type uncharacterized transport system fused permease/ATPase subunit